MCAQAAGTQAQTKNTNWKSSVQELNKFYSRNLSLHVWNQGTFKGVAQARMVKIINFLFFAQKVSSDSGALRPKFFWASGTRTPQKWEPKGIQFFFFFCIVHFHCLLIYSSNT